jgi:class 3 adenylate cyclase/tetratricopeptide (TPR) repeat protein
MRCPQCELESPATAIFCGGCGTRLVVRCHACRATSPPGASVCSRCGAPLPAAVLPDDAWPQAEAPPGRAYAPPAGPRLEEERKRVTVLFADVEGSMELLADRDPEEARELLDAVIDRMMEAVHHYEGTVNQVRGDGIMALFGAPVAREDHAVRACFAALRMHGALADYAAAALVAWGIQPRIRVGINSGEVLVRARSSELHTEYTAIGSTTHLAARMEGLAAPGTTLITTATLHLAQGYVEVRALGPVAVKGIAEPVEVYELIGAGPVRSRLQAAVGRGLSRLVGREHELAQLELARQEAGEGRGRVVALVGEPGVGKSRLVWELARSSRALGWRVLEGGAVSYEKATSYSPVSELLRADAGIDARDGDDAIRRKVAERLQAVDPALAPHLPAVLALLAVPVEDAGWEALDPSERRRRTLDALTGLFVGASRLAPLLLVLEDLHAIDSETEAFLDALIERLPGARVLLLLTYRPEYRHAWSSHEHYRELGLPLLATEPTAELLRELVGPERELESLRQMLGTRTEGNPFFLEEMVRSLAETGALAGRPGGYRLTAPPEAIDIPATVQAVLAARIDRLAAEDKYLLQVAAVIGREAPLALLRAVAGRSDDELRGGLARLEDGGFLHQVRLFPDIEYAFTHLLALEVTYAGLVLERRRTMHARIAAAIEALAAGRPEQHVEQLAHHGVLGERWDRAVVHLRAAGVRALDRFANREARAWLEQALGALAHLPDRRETRELAFDVRLALRRALLGLGEVEEIVTQLRAAEALARALDDGHRLALVWSYLTHYHWAVAQHDRALEAGARALELALPLGDARLVAETTFYLGIVELSLGRHRQAVDTLRRSLDSDAGAGRPAAGRAGAVASALTRTYLARGLAELGDFDEALAAGREGLRLAEASEHAFALIGSRFGIGSVYLRKGDFPQAIDALGPALELCRGTDLGNWFPAVGASLGAAYARSGRVTDGLSLLERALDRARALRLRASFSLWLTYLAEAQLLAGRIADARRAVGEALDVSRAQLERGYHARALWLLGEVVAAGDGGDPGAAFEHLRRALTLADELEMVPLRAHCRLALGRLCRRVGQEPEAVAHLSAAARTFARLGMESWLEQARAGLAGAPGPGHFSRSRDIRDS